MEEMLNKLELMLIGLRQMKINVVFTWFPKIDKEEIIKAIEASPKFKIEGNFVMLKTETEIYEEELQKDILKELMNEKDEIDMLDDFDDDIELIEIPLEDDKVVEDVNNIWSDSKNLVNSIEDDLVIQEVEAVEEIKEDDVVLENSLSETAASIFNNEVEIKEEVEEKVVEQVIDKIIVRDTSLLKGSDIKYEELVRLVTEYSASTLEKLSLSDQNKFEMQEKAIKTFYGQKYNVKIKERNFYGENTNIYSLIHKKRGMEVGYLLICNRLTDEILNYVLDNYDDEVVYFCPLQGSEVRFEIGLNEFFLKDTGIILDKYLEHYEIKDECDFNIKKVEVVIGR